MEETRDMPRMRPRKQKQPKRLPAWDKLRQPAKFFIAPHAKLNPAVGGFRSLEPLRIRNAGRNSIRIASGTPNACMSAFYSIRHKPTSSNEAAPGAPDSGASSKARRNGSMFGQRPVTWMRKMSLSISKDVVQR
jgi:hypothetical protein